MYYDISWPLTPTTTEYKDRKTLTFTDSKTFERDQARQTILCMDVHTGTHVDAPSHFLKEGKSLDLVPLESFIGPCLVLDLSGYAVITAKELASYTIDKTIILLKTKNSLLSFDRPFEKEFVYLDATGAEYLAQKGVRSVGIDYLSIEREQPGHQTHKILFEQNIPVIEGLRLAEVPQGNYYLICLPLKLDREAAPARALLFSRPPGYES